ncbi:MAG TPA: hypothetical protein VES20_10915 [Bryobacteraceae bacterium]|nr:hypothetical protein [Bryobacteraceae bacterium]
MKSQNKMILSMALGVLLAASAPAVVAGERSTKPAEIQQMARNANTPEEHAKVAKLYLSRADELSSTADRLERQVREGTLPMGQKWPGMIAGMRDKQERNAMQARRAANEARELALHHSRLAGRSLDQLSEVD